MNLKFQEENRKVGWTEEDERFIRDHYFQMPITEIAETLQRSVDAVRWKASKLKVSYPKAQWTKADLFFLATHYQSMSLKQVADWLGKSETAVRKQAGLLNIFKNQRTDKIDALNKGVPYFKGKTGEYMALLNTMEIGDSLEFPKEDRQTIQNCMSNFPDKNFRTKKESEATRRVWRLL